MNNNSGFTIIELMIAITVSGILMVALLTVVVNRFVEIRRINARSNMQVDARNVLDVMARDITQSSSVDPIERWPDANEPSAPNNWVSDNNTLVLASPAYNDDKQPLFEDPNLYITYKNNYIYFLNNNRLFKRVLADTVNENAATNTCPKSLASSSCPADTLLAANVESLEFTYHDSNGEEIEIPEQARSVRIHLSLSEEIYNTEEVVTRTVETVFRN